MVHEMKLNLNPFTLIKNGEKDIEVRLFDDKRRLIKIGDQITFTKLPEMSEKIEVIVEKILVYPNFKSLFTDFDGIHFGADGWSVSDQVNNMYQYYTTEDETKFGVVGIKFHKKTQ